jgi:hypothetical protein
MDGSYHHKLVVYLNFLAVKTVLGFDLEERVESFYYSLVRFIDVFQVHYASISDGRHDISLAYAKELLFRLTKLGHFLPILSFEPV